MILTVWTVTEHCVGLIWGSTGAGMDQFKEWTENYSAGLWMSVGTLQMTLLVIRCEDDRIRSASSDVEILVSTLRLKQSLWLAESHSSIWSDYDTSSVEPDAVLSELILLHALLQDSHPTPSSRNVNNHLHISRRCNGLRTRGGFSRVTDPHPQITSCNLISHLKHSDICAVYLPS